MADSQEITEVKGANSNPDAVLASLRSKVPLLCEIRDSRDPLKLKAVTAIKVKIVDVLKEYADSEDKDLVTVLLSETIAVGCVTYKIDPVELIIISRTIRQGERHVAMADRKRVGPMDIKQFFIDPSEIMFRVQILSQHGDTTAKNITDLMFAFAHEMAHLGQLTHAEEDLIKSKQFDYASRPTEKHADEVALAYCRDLNAVLKKKQNLTRADILLRAGLPQTIKEAEKYGRPRM